MESGEFLENLLLFYLYYFSTTCVTWLVSSTSALGRCRNLTDGFRRSIQLRQSRKIESEPFHICFGCRKISFMMKASSRKDVTERPSHRSRAAAPSITTIIVSAWPRRPWPLGDKGSLHGLCKSVRSGETLRSCNSAKVL